MLFLLLAAVSPDRVAKELIAAALPVQARLQESQPFQRAASWRITDPILLTVTGNKSRDFKFWHVQ